MTVARRGGPCKRTTSFAIAAAFRLAPSRIREREPARTVRPLKHVAASTRLLNHTAYQSRQSVVCPRGRVPPTDRHGRQRTLGHSFCVSAYIYTCVSVCASVCLCAYMCSARVCVFVCVCVCVRASTLCERSRTPVASTRCSKRTRRSRGSMDAPRSDHVHIPQVLRLTRN